MAEAGNPQPDGPRAPASRGRGDRGRDPAALAAWRRVADQRRRAVDQASSPGARSTSDRPTVEPSTGDLSPDGRSTDGRSPADRSTDGRSSAEPATVEPATVQPATVEPATVERATVQPATVERATVEPAVEPAAVEPVAGDPAVGERPEDERPDAPRSATAASDRSLVWRPADRGPGTDRPAARATTDRPAVTRPAARPVVDRRVAGVPVPPRAGGRTGDVPARAGHEDDAGHGPTREPARPSPSVTRETPGPAPTRAPSGDEPPSVGRLHDVLLGLAGRLDDDALSSVREMVAAEDDAEAAELLGGCLLAGGIGLTDEERAVLRPWFGAARVDPELLGLLPADSEALGRSAHRFVTTGPDRSPGTPLARAARRLTGVVAVRESWRITPAGSAPGPVPHRVVLVETEGPDDCDHVVHHLAHAARALDATSVEVFATGSGLPAYHRAALAAARPLVADEPATTGAAPSPAPVPPAPASAERSAPAPDEETWRTVADAGTSRTGPGPVVPPEPTEVGDDDRPDLADLDEPDAGGAESAGPDTAGPDGAGSEGVDLHSAGSDKARSDTADPDAAGQDTADPDAAGQDPAGPGGAGPDEADETRADREVAETSAARERPAAPDVAPQSPAAPPAPETSIDEDLSSTARRIAALWARPSPEDFSAPLPAESLEPTRLEPARDDDPDASDDEDEAPTGRHGRPSGPDMGTTSFRSPRARSRTNGRSLRRAAEPAADRADPPVRPAADPAPASASSGDDASEPDAAQLPRTRQRRSRDGDASPDPDSGPIRFGHDARFGAGPGPAWPGGPVTGSPRPGPDTLFTSPVEVGEEPVSFGTNGHRHGTDPVAPDDEPDTLGTNGHRHDPVAADDEPDTGPVAWSSPAGPIPVTPPPGPRPVGPPPAAGPNVVPPPPPPPGPQSAGPGARHPGDPGEHTAFPRPSADPAGWTVNGHGRVPDGAPGRPPESDGAAPWSPEDDSVAQLSDRERELLARLHEELAQRERSDGADPFGPSRPGPQRPRSPGPRPPRPGAPGGRVNGHGLPSGGPDDASA